MASEGTELKIQSSPRPPVHCGHMPQDSRAPQAESIAQFRARHVDTRIIATDSTIGDVLHPVAQLQAPRIIQIAPHRQVRGEVEMPAQFVARKLRFAEPG